MNPFNLKKVGTSAQDMSADELLRQHHVDPSIKDRLLEVARAEERAHPTNPTTSSSNQPVEPPDDTPLNMHKEIMIIPNFLSPEICAEYVEYIKKQQEVDLSVFDAQATNKTGKIEWEVDKKTRDTQTVDIDPIKSVVVDLMRLAVRDYLNPFYNVTIKDSELPQILVYHGGGHYRPHIDAEALFNDGSGVLSWKKNVARDISIVVYLNGDFEGGEIVFPKQAISVKPREGLMLAFPSNHHFLHGVNPVTKGVRYAIVDWFSLGEDAEK